MAHIPVLLHEVVDGLRVSPGDTVVDGTLGEGGHARALAELIGPTGTLVGIDADARALVRATKILTEVPCRTVFLEGNFRDIKNLLTEKSIDHPQAILLDLGVNSGQLDDDDRGFSFKNDVPLVMTLSAHPEEAIVTAYDVVNSWSETTLADVIFAYGEERFARRIAKGIVEARRQAPIKTTGDLVTIIKNSVPVWYAKGRLHPATKTFQAIRIAVNDELEVLKQGLASSLDILASDGRLAVISFHSLEARIVKEFFKAEHAAGRATLVTKKAIKPSRTEELVNPRSRSAQLRIIQKN